MTPNDTEAAGFLDDNAQWVLRLATVLTPTPQDAEDVAQEVLIRATRHLGRLRGARNPRAYLRRMVINESMRRPRDRIDLVQAPPEQGSLETGYARLEARHEAHRLLATLTPRQAAAVALRYLEECDYPAIAAALRCREATARSLVKRGIDQLRRDARAEQNIGLGR